MFDLAVYACDIGSTRSKRTGFAWARRVADGFEPAHANTSIDDLVENLVDDITEGMAVALGMDCPLYLPVPNDDFSLLKMGRIGERERSSLTQKGGHLAALGLHQLAYLLHRVSDSLGREHPAPPFYLDWRRWQEGMKPRGAVLFWEAHVSATCQSDRQDPDHHFLDARLAAETFWTRAAAGNLVSDLGLRQGTSCLSLTGAALLWAGWSNDLSLLKQEILVIRPPDCQAQD